MTVHRPAIAALLFTLATATATGGCERVQHVSNRQIAIGVGVVVIAAVVIYAATQSHCDDNNCLNF